MNGFADFSRLSFTQAVKSGRLSMKYHLLSATLIIAAIALEMAGSGTAGSNLGATLYVAGVACEFWFWIRLGLVKTAPRHGSPNHYVR
jgi:hypothetical protein